jgi:hypothetical protein
MKIPNADSAIIDPQKIAGYVLNAEHRRGGSKASLLLAFGYDPVNWQRLADDLRRDHLSDDVDLTRETTYGMRYEIRAAIQTPSGRQVFLRSIWQIDLGATAPRLITLYPD